MNLVFEKNKIDLTTYLIMLRGLFRKKKKKLSTYILCLQDTRFKIYKQIPSFFLHYLTFPLIFLFLFFCSLLSYFTVNPIALSAFFFNSFFFFLQFILLPAVFSWIYVKHLFFLTLLSTISESSGTKHQMVIESRMHRYSILAHVSISVSYLISSIHCIPHMFLKKMMYPCICTRYLHPYWV